MTISAINNKNYLITPITDNLSLLPSALSTKQKILKYSIYFFTCGLAYILYETAKLLQKSLFSILPGRKLKINPESKLSKKERENISKYKTLGLNTLNFISGRAKKKSKLSFGIESSTFKQAKNEGKSLILPIITKGLFRDHIIFLGINFKKRQMVFFDPKGQTISDLKNRKISYPTTCDTISESWSKIYGILSDMAVNSDIQDKSLNGWKLLQNTREIQKDSYNCGVHFYNACEIFESGADPEKIFEDNSVLDTREKISDKREDIITAMESTQSGEPEMLDEPALLENFDEWNI
ncbi:MAG: hypothetical protein WCT85_00445 [Parachlamydiales bacterium]|jgi:hypothetical protein